MRNNIHEETGQVAIEYALVILLLVVATVISLVALNGAAASFFSSVADAVRAVV